MGQRLANLTKKNIEFHQKMAKLAPGTASSSSVAHPPSEKLLIHPFVNPDSVFFNRTDHQENAFVELTGDQITPEKYPFSFDDQNVTLITVGPKTK